MKNLLYIFFATVLVACSDAIVTNPNNNEDLDELSVPDMTGEVIRFVSVSKNGSESRATRADDNKDEKYEIDKFEYVGKKESDKFYDFKIEMYKESNAIPLATANYDIKEKDDNTGYQQDGTLAPKFQSTPLYWPDNVNEYGFKVTACTNEIKINQDDPAHFDDNSEDISKHSGYNFWTNDMLEGYSYMPGRFDNIDEINYRSNKKWYLHNKYRWAEFDNQGAPSTEEYKKVPLYLKHKRAWITIVLKAGQGVEQNLLAFENSKNTLSGSVIYSKSTDGFKEITPWRVRKILKENESDQTGIETTELNAIVEPHDYRGVNGIEDMIGKIKLSDMTFTYSPSNDDHFEDPDKIEVYNLTEGKHLTITAILTTDKIVFISARIEDWEEVTFGSICDDYGYNGDPILIKSRSDLYNFLTSEQNKPGNIALISAASLNLDVEAQDGTLTEPWQPQELRCALNLAGSVISCKGQFLTNITKNGSLINGTINITGDTPITAAICDDNHGIIEYVNVTVKDDDTYQNAYATRGGICSVNYGEILYCTSDLQVNGTGSSDESFAYIGGIAGESKKSSEAGSTLPIIDHCTVNGRVNATGDKFYCAGIAGYAEYRVTYNTFNYGMTLLQATSGYKTYANIVASTSTSSEATASQVEATGNSWPTSVSNNIGERVNISNNMGSDLYYAVIDSQAELAELVTKYYNHQESGKPIKVRIANNFDVNNDVNNEWIYGVENGHNLAFELDGNDKTITTHGKMLFSNITGYFHDFTIMCATDLKAEKKNNASDYGNSESIAPLAYSVNSNNNSGAAHLKNIKVITAENTKISGPVPSGLIVWAYDNAIIEDCKVKADIQVQFSERYSESLATKYAGGIAAMSNIATFSGCHFYGNINEDSSLSDASFKYRGGIVGGVAKSDQIAEDPFTIIKECASWWPVATDSEDDNNEENRKASPIGAIIGNTKTSRTGSDDQESGIGKGCEGNWWASGNAAGNLNEDEAILVLGKKNGIQPQKDL